jgi:uncharacterized membrane protein YtjA (UPF0391 family)
MFVGSLRMAVSLRRLVSTLRVVAPAVMFGSHPMALRGSVMVFRGLIVRVLGHVSPLFSSCNPLLSSCNSPERLDAVIVPDLAPTRDAQLCSLHPRNERSWRPSRLQASAFGRRIGTRPRLRRLAAQQRVQRQEAIMFSWAIAFLVIALIAAALGFGVVSGTAFAAAKIIFIVTLLAFLISGVLGFTRRGIP